MHLRPITTAESDAYDELARLHGTLFNRLDWLSLFGDKTQAYGVFDKGAELVAGFALYQERRFGLKILRPASFTPNCGPFMKIRAKNPVAILEERRSVIEGMAKLVDQLDPAVCMLSLAQSTIDALPFFWRGFKVSPSYTYLMDLTMSVDQIRKNMSSERRKNLAKAASDGLEIRRETDMAVIRDLVLATFGRQSMAVDRNCLNAILFQYAKPENSFAFVTYRGETPIACSFMVHGDRTAYYLLGGYRVDQKHHGAGASSMFAAIQHAKEIGLQCFDFEGSVIPPIERYIRGFGGRLTPYLTVTKAWMPVEIALKFLPRLRNRF